MAVVNRANLSSFVFAWENAERIPARTYINEKSAKNHDIFGSLFFGSAVAFSEKFKVENDPEVIIINFRIFGFPLGPHLMC